MKYFTLEEFACKHCGELPEDGMNPVLLEALDELREKVGHPIFVTSGYRCEINNAANGGVSNSQHLLGNAADIVCPDMTYEDFYQAVLDSETFDGCGHYPEQQFVHVDCRENGEMPNYYLWEG